VRGRLAAVLAAVLATSMAAAGCGVPVDREPRPLSAGEIPRPLPSFAEAPAETGEEGAAAASVYFVRDGRLVRVSRELAPTATLEEVLAAVSRGPTASERAEGIRSALTGDVNFAGLASGVPLLDVTDAVVDVELDQRIVALAQLVYTLTAVAGIDGVSFVHSGRPVEVPTGDGTLKRGPVRRTDYAAVAPEG
jgi:spore germination protein GerM